jgi:hypothetical protein
MNAMTATIGHNMPPEPIDPFAAMATHINDLYELAEGALIGGEIDTPEKAEQIEALKADLKKAVADADKARKAEKEPHLEAGRAVDAKWKELTDKGTLAAKTAATALTPWLQKVQAEKDAEQERLRKEAEAKAEEARKAFVATAPTDLEARANAEQLAKEVAKATAAANRINRAPTGLRTCWNATVTDYGALLAYMKQSDPQGLRDMLDEYAQKQKNAGVRMLPGVLIEAERKAA